MIYFYRDSLFVNVPVGFLLVREPVFIVLVAVGAVPALVGLQSQVHVHVPLQSPLICEGLATLVTMEAQVLRCRVVGENVTPQMLAGTDFCVTLRARDCWKHVLLHVLFVL